MDVDDLVIEGNGHTIDACRKVQIFNCTGKNITIKNITLKNGSAGGGGAIYNKSIFNIWGLLTNESKYESNNCIFKYNKPDDVYE